ncbi:DUF4225 domain-containing protein [Xenorhabdus poinarii]|nr:DUF4225 domain-containing protein [Xenorhabdus poinarii]
MDIASGKIGFTKMYGLYGRSGRESYFRTQALHKKTRMRQLALSTSIFINSNVSRKKYIDELNYLSDLYERHIFSSDNSEERKSILQMMGKEIKYLEYQEHLCRYKLYQQYALIETNNRGMDNIDYVLKGVGIVVGLSQIVAGIGLIAGATITVFGIPVGYVAGAGLVVHGFGAIQENTMALIKDDPNYKGLVRLGYENTFEYLGSSKTTGSLVYAGVDLSLSAHALLSRTLKPDAWRLFHHINEDYVYGYKLMSGYALGFEITADGLTIKSAYDIYNNPNYNK